MFSTAKKPQIKPNAAKENATGKPINMMSIKPKNIRGAKFSILIAMAFHNESPSHRHELTMQVV